MARSRATIVPAALRERAREVPENVDVEAVLGGLSYARGATESVGRHAQAASAPVLAPTGRLLAAATVWATATFLLCYVAIPIGYSVMGLRAFVLPWVLPSHMLAFAFTWIVTTAAMLTLASRRGGVDVDLHGLGGSDRIPAAMLGGLVVWGLLHNLLPGLMPFGAMSLSFLGAFMLANIVENALFGTLLATFTKSRRGAFAAGAAFQTAFALSAWMF